MEGEDEDEAEEEGKKKKKPLTKKEQRRLDEQARVERERLQVRARVVHVVQALLSRLVVIYFLYLMNRKFGAAGSEALQLFLFGIVVFAYFADSEGVVSHTVMYAVLS